MGLRPALGPRKRRELVRGEITSSRERVGVERKDVVGVGKRAAVAAELNEAGKLVELAVAEGEEHKKHAAVELVPAEGGHRKHAAVVGVVRTKHVEGEHRKQVVEIAAAAVAVEGEHK